MMLGKDADTESSMKHIVHEARRQKRPFLNYLVRYKLPWTSAQMLALFAYARRVGEGSIDHSNKLKVCSCCTHNTIMSIANI